MDNYQNSYYFRDYDRLNLVCSSDYDGLNLIYRSDYDGLNLVCIQ